MSQILRKFRRRKRRRLEEGEGRPASPALSPHGNTDRLGPYYSAGPAHELAQAGEGEIATRRAEEEVAPVREVEPELPTLNLAGQGEPEQVAAYLRGPLRLQGRTDATFDGGTYETTGVRVTAATGCSGCGECLHVVGTLVARYSVTTQVTLPSISDYPGLTPCQRQRVQNAIDTVLAPHEQQHVRAFSQYNGVTRHRFDLTLCRSEFDAAIEAMFQAEATARQQAAQAASDALDPFHFDVDLNCEESRRSAQQVQAVTGTQPPEDENA